MAASPQTESELEDFIEKELFDYYDVQVYSRIYVGS